MTAPGSRIEVACASCGYVVAALTMPDLRKQLGPMAAMMIPAGAVDGTALARWLELTCVVCLGGNEHAAPTNGETNNAA